MSDFLQLKNPTFAQNIINIFYALFTVLIIVISTPTSANNNLPNMGQSADSYLSQEEEKKLGIEFMRSVRRSLHLVEDLTVNEYIQSLGDKLASQLDAEEFDFQFFIVDDESINAFAGPAGYIGIHSGLFLATHSESELASVIAHEIAHITQRHLVRSFKTRSDMTLPAMAAIIAAILLGKGDSQIGEAVLATTIATTTQQQLSFSRTNEQEADRLGIDVLFNAGFNPDSMAVFFETLQSKNRYNGVDVPEFLLTHPITVSRISDARNRARQYNNKTSASPSNFDSRYFQIIHARLNALSAIKKIRKSNNDLSQYLGFSMRYKENTAKQYYELMLNRELGSFQKSQQQINTLIKSDRARIPYIIAKAELEIKAQQIKNAQQTLAEALIVYPGNTPLSMLYADTLLKTNQSDRALRIIEQQPKNPINGPQFFRLQANAAKLSGFLGEAHEYMAEYYYALGNLHMAISHINKALNLPDNDPYQKLRLSSKLQQLKSQVLNNQPKEKQSPEQPR